jgi:membrane protein
MTWSRPSPTSLAGLLLETGRRLLAIDVVQHSAALAYYSALSLGPLVVITLGVTGLIIDRGAMQEHVASAVGGVVGPQAAELVRALGQDERDTGGGALAAMIGALMLVVTASAVFAQLQAGLNAVWRVEGKPRGSLWHFVRTRLISMTMATCLGFLLLVSLLANALISALGERLGELLGERAALVVPTQFVATFAIMACVFALLFKLLPNARVPWRAAWTGALLTTVLFQLGAWAIGVYVGRAGVGSAYGAAGSIVVLLVWVFYASLMLFAGAQFAAVQAASRAVAATPPAE